MLGGVLPKKKEDKMICYFDITYKGLINSWFLPGLALTAFFSC